MRESASLQQYQSAGTKTRENPARFQKGRIEHHVKHEIFTLDAAPARACAKVWSSRADIAQDHRQPAVSSEARLRRL